MNCIYCGGETWVHGTRLTKTKGLRRSRDCNECGKRFHTTELTDADLKDLRYKAKTFDKIDDLLFNHFNAK